MKIKISVIFTLLLLITNCSNNSKNNIDSRINLILNEEEEKVDVMVDGKLFTSFLYTDALDMLKKPVLYPLISANGVIVTRGYPLDPRPNERTDHPHHIGIWLNYGDVNGLDFWNNSDAIPAKRESKMGTIRLRKIKAMESGDDEGKLSVVNDWLDSEGNSILEENSWIGPGVIFTNARYPRSQGVKETLKGPRIHSGAIIGAGAVLLPGIVIGQNALVGGGAVVVEDVRDGAVVVGNPAQVIKYIKNITAYQMESK